MRIFLCILLISGNLFAQESKIVALHHDWKPGETRRYVLTMEKPPRDPTRTLLEMQAVQSLNKGTEFKWSYLECRKLDDSPLDSASAALFKILRDIPARYETDEDGFYVTNIESPESARAYATAIDAIVKEVPEKDRASLKASMLLMLKAGAFQANKEMWAFHGAHGAEFRIGSRHSQEASLTLMNTQIPAIVTSEAVELPGKRIRALIRYVSEGENAVKALEASVRKMFVQLGKPEPTEKMFDSVNVIQECAYIFEENSSWPERIECSTESTVKSGAREESRREAAKFLPESDWKANKEK